MGADWNRYQNLIKEHNPGFSDAKHVPYPYTMDMVKGWFDRYNKDLQANLEPLGCYPVSHNGPNQAFKDLTMRLYADAKEAILKKMIPQLIVASKLLSKAEDGDDPIMDALGSVIYTLKRDLTVSAPDSKAPEHMAALDF